MCLLGEAYGVQLQGIGAWYAESSSGAAPEARHESAFVALNGKFYLLGGRGKRTIQVYDPATNTWTNTETSTSNINHFQAVVYDNKIYIVGAFTGNYPKESPVSTIRIYDPATDQLIEGPTIPENRRRGSTGTVVYNNKIYIVGGNRNGHSAFMADGVTPANVAWFDEYDPTTNTWKTLPDAPHARDHFAAIVVNDKLYVTGGRRSKFGTPDGTFNDMEGAVDVYDFTSGQWLSGSSLPANIPTKRAGVSAALLNNEIIVMGGEVDYNPPSNLALKTTEALNINTGTWRTLAPLQLGRHATQAIVHQGDIYIAGGSRTKGGNEITAQQTYLEVFSFDGPPQDSMPPRVIPFPDWTNVSTAPQRRVESPAVVYKGELYIFNGFRPSYKIENSNIKYNPSTNTWTQLAPIPLQPDSTVSAVTHNGIALVGDTVWIVGGRVGNVPGPPTDRVWWYKISTNTWTPGPRLPTRAAGGGVGRLGRKLHYVGGLDTVARCDVNYHWVFDLDNPAAGWQDLTEEAGLPEARNHFGTAVLEGKLYIIGGQYGHDGCQQGVDVKFVHVFDPITNAWKQLNDLPFEESHMEPGTFAIDGKIYMVGGQLRGRHVRIYDPINDSWTRIRELDLPEPLLSPVARIFGDTLISAFGGAPGTSNPVAYTLMHTIQRTPLLQLGFNPKQLSLQLNQGETRIVETILYSQAGTALYKIQNNLPSWLSIDKTSGSVVDSDEEITLQFSTANLAPGTYTYQLVASAPGYTDGTINITLQVNRGSVTEQRYFLEAECGEVGSTWTLIRDTVAASRDYVIVNRRGFNSLSVPPVDIPENKIVFNVNIAQAGTYRLFARVKAPTVNDDSFWVRINNGNWISWSDGFLTTVFAWKEVLNSPFALVAGNNVIEFLYRENGTALDKIYITNTDALPDGKGETALNCNGNLDSLYNHEANLEKDPNARKARMKLFPNPAHSVVQLQVDFLRPSVAFQADVIDLQGRVLQSYQWDTFDLNATYSLRITNFAPGVYVVRVVQGGVQLSKQLVIE